MMSNCIFIFHQVSGAMFYSKMFVLLKIGQFSIAVDKTFLLHLGSKNTYKLNNMLILH